MSELLIGAASGLWLGILTSISPCPLATNIAAISFISNRIARPRDVFLTRLFYALGRALTYVVIGILLVASILSAPTASHFLQKYMNKILGPLLIMAGMFLLELPSVHFSGGGVSGQMQKRDETLGIWGGALLGVLFALTFCPVSTALFFGSLIPLAIRFESGFLLPSLYGIGTGLPVFVFALLIAIGAGSLGKAFNSLGRFEWWARRVTGIIFIGVGLYLSLAHIFGVFS